MKEPARAKSENTIPVGPRPWEGVLVGMLFFLVVAGLTLLMINQVLPQILEGQLMDSDGYMRLVRVRNLMATGDWFDSTIPRSNAPFGEVLHWTRPLDVLLLLGTAILRPIFPWPDALHWAGVVLPPFLLFLTGVAAAWTSQPFTGRRMKFVAMIAVVAQIGVIQATLPGRPDHHALHVLLAVIALGMAVRWVLRPFSWPIAVSTGAVAGMGLWVGPEFLLMVSPLLLAGVFLWVREGGEWAPKNLWFSVGVWGILVLAWLLENPPPRLFLAQYDKVSFPHVAMGFLAVLYWVGLSHLFRGGAGDLTDAEGWDPKGSAGEDLSHSEVPKARERVPRSGPESDSGLRGPRLLGAGLAGLVALGALYAIFPSFFLGPEAGIDPQLSPLWRRFVIEDQPLLNSGGQNLAGNILLYLGSPLVCVPFLVKRLVAEDERPGWNAWLLLSFVLAVFLPLALFRFRFVAYPEIASVPVLAAFVSRTSSGFRSVPHPFLRALFRGGAAALLICGPLLTGAILTGSREGGQSSPSSGSTGSCPISAMAEALDTLPSAGEGPKTIAAHLGYGPEILYRTRHRVIGTPYHRNSDGILSLFSILAGTPERARQEVFRRNVDWLLVCPSQSWLYTRSLPGEGDSSEGGNPQEQTAPPGRDNPQEPEEGEARSGSPGSGEPQVPASLHNRLLAGEIPEWLEALPLSEEPFGEFLLFRVRTGGSEERPGTPTDFTAGR